MSYNVEVALHAKATLGEGPHWDQAKGVLYWVDILQKKLHIYDPATNDNRTILFEQYIGAVVPTTSGQVLLAMENGIYQYNLETEELTCIADPEADQPTNRFNDGKCDPSGRFWAGTMSLTESNHKGSLYRLDPSGQITKMVSSVTISNGLAWSPDRKFMYYIDTPTREVAVYSYDEASGEIIYIKACVQIPEGMGNPDGMTIDSEGMIWVAHWGGARVTRWNPHTGTLLEEIPLPAKNVTSCTFGGENLDELYITTAKIGMTESELERYPGSGNLFRVKTNYKGLPANPFNK
ncbi:SMP-30/gluconolactonase/LRE family protein [Halalkalibacter kiskunsagensis]|uniref:SMP-30/gluconolactonase/LRE family protein n=1 Tax=Halalkalibacter kiskunsagensis TaxID=1548599 RepID=A0ABV6KH48_9BACI